MKLIWHEKVDRDHHLRTDITCSQKRPSFRDHNPTKENRYLDESDLQLEPNYAEYSFIIFGWKRMKDFYFSLFYSIIFSSSTEEWGYSIALNYEDNFVSRTQRLQEWTCQRQKMMPEVINPFKP